jgi:hypothetical protein
MGGIALKPRLSPGRELASKRAESPEGCEIPFKLPMLMTASLGFVFLEKAVPLPDRPASWPHRQFSALKGGFLLADVKAPLSRAARALQMDSTDVVDC